MKVLKGCYVCDSKLLIPSFRLWKLSALSLINLGYSWLQTRLKGSNGRVSQNNCSCKSCLSERCFHSASKKITCSLSLSNTHTPMGRERELTESLLINLSAEPDKPNTEGKNMENHGQMVATTVGLFLRAPQKKSFCFLS